MLTHSGEGRSPLDDYFADAGMAEHPQAFVPDNGSDAMDEQEDEDWGDETLVNTSSASMKGWTGSRPNTPGPSSPRRQSSPSRPALTGSRGLEDMEQDRSIAAAVAEKFKYLVCTSGLLDKDLIGSRSELVGSYSSAWRNAEREGALFTGDERSPRPETLVCSDQPPDVSPILTTARHPPAFEFSLLRQRLSHRLQQVDWAGASRSAVERWDISLAAVVLTLAVMVIVGLRRVMLWLGCMILFGIGWEWWSLKAESAGHGEQPAGVVQTETDTAEWFDQSPSYTNLKHDNPAHSPTTLPLPYGPALLSLDSLLSACSELDADLTRSLALLSSSAYFSAPTVGKPLQLSLHRLCGDMTDHVASCISSLAGMVDHREVEILSEMYDVQPAGRLGSSRSRGRGPGRRSERDRQSGSVASGLLLREEGWDGTQRIGQRSGDRSDLRNSVGEASLAVDAASTSEHDESSPTDNRSSSSSRPPSRRSSLIPASSTPQSPPSTIRALRLSLGRQPLIRHSSGALSIPMSNTQSLPSRLSDCLTAYEYRRNLASSPHINTRHLSPLAPVPPYSASVHGPSGDNDNDRFTSIPVRTPRLSKRASWDPSLMQGRPGGEGDPSWSHSAVEQESRWTASDTTTTVTATAAHRPLISRGSVGFGVPDDPVVDLRRTGSGRRIMYERRITEADKSGYGGGGMESLDDGWLSTSTSTSTSTSASRGLTTAVPTAEMDGTSRSDNTGASDSLGAGLILSDQSSALPSVPGPRPFASGFRPLSLPCSPTLSRRTSPSLPHTPKFASPLSPHNTSGSAARLQRLSERAGPFPASLTESAIRLASLTSPPSAFPAVPRAMPQKGQRLCLAGPDRYRPRTGVDDPKRRSLQNMPYCSTPTPSSPSFSDTASPSTRIRRARASDKRRIRTRSLVSTLSSQASMDLQELRERSATGTARARERGRGEVGSGRDSTSICSRASLVSVHGKSISEARAPDLNAEHRNPPFRAGRSPSTVGMLPFPQASLGHAVPDDRLLTDSGLESDDQPQPNDHESRHPHRIPSVSPLTLPALKAACLGIHLKRRRVAISLLALRFSCSGDYPNTQHALRSPSPHHPGMVADREDYWGSVRDVLDTFRDAIESDRADLRAVHQRVEADIERVVETIARSTRLTPPWTSPSIKNVLSADRQDFGPTTSHRAKMAEHCDTIQRALERAWAEVAIVQRSLLSDQDLARALGKNTAETQCQSQILQPEEGVDADAVDASFERNWGALREELGIMIREVERGRESLRLLRAETEETENPVDLDDSVEIGGHSDGIEQAEGKDAVSVLDVGDLPDFTRDWESTPDLSDPQIVEPVADGIDQPLPPPGMDKVYEAYIPPAPPARSSASAALGEMSRAERVAMMRLAREKGMTLGDYLRGSQLDIGEDGHAEVDQALSVDRAADPREQGGRVVHELKGVIGIIRERKGRNSVGVDMGDGMTLPNPGSEP